MVTKEEVVGRPTGKATITLERGPVTQFAASVLDKNPIYRRADAARDAGFDDIPVPPTYFFSAATMFGAFPEDQPADANPDTNPTMEIIGSLMSKGGMVLHGEQEFIYHGGDWPHVGDTLVGEGSISDVYEKEKSSGGKLEFYVTETTWKNERTGQPVVTTKFTLAINCKADAAEPKPLS